MKKNLKVILSILLIIVILMVIMVIINMVSKEPKLESEIVITKNDEIIKNEEVVITVKKEQEVATSSITDTKEDEKNTTIKEEDKEIIKEVDYSRYHVDESGVIPIIMFHTFVNDFENVKDKEYTTTFSEFEALLEELYEKNYRLISMNEYISGNIDIPLGTKPVLFTFDDGTSSQFNFIEENGTLVVNPKSAVGVLEKFNEKHPDFGEKGIFYVYMIDEWNLFRGSGEFEDRFKYLIDKGYEIGNHTYGHANLKKLQNSQLIAEEIGKNIEAYKKIIPEGEMNSLSLPYGEKPEDENLYKVVKTGEYKELYYKNETIMAVGSEPALPSHHIDYNGEYVPRIRGKGYETVWHDISWWLQEGKLDKMVQYISDGNPNIITVPEKHAEYIVDKIDVKVIKY